MTGQRTGVAVQVIVAGEGVVDGVAALCSLKCAAALAADLDPDRVSFTATVRVARDHAAGSISQHAQARRDAVHDILQDLLPRRRGRQCERVKKPPKNTFPTKKRDTAQPASKASYKIKITKKCLYLHRRLNSPALQVRCTFSRSPPRSADNR